MPAFICATCGVQYPPTDDPPVSCAVCLDERQYVPVSGQRWTTPEELQAAHRNRFTELEPGLFEIHTEPDFAIGQRALLVVTAQGNLLWDCLSLIDQETQDQLAALGGVAAMAISHPHFYGALADWSDRMGQVPIWLPTVDRAFLMRPHPSVRHFAQARIAPLPSLSLIRLGGHFHGSTVLLWPQGAGGRGALLTGDTISPVADPDRVTFLYSYPNRVPLGADQVARIAASCRELAFDRLYGGFPKSTIAFGADRAVELSAQRYLGMLDGSWPRR